MKKTLVLVTAVLGFAAPAARAQSVCGDLGKFNNPEIVGLTSDQRLVCFFSNKPKVNRLIGFISGLTGADASILGIDFRPATGELYGLGDAGGIYTIDITTAVATLKSQLTGPTLVGTQYAVDFNPAADRLRIVSASPGPESNLRVNVDTGVATIDLSLTAGAVRAAAYTNNDASANSGTTLFDIDEAGDSVLIQSPPNNGNLVATGKLAVGDVSGPMGFDISTRITAGEPSGLRAFVSFYLGGVARLASVTLLTGRAVLVNGAFPAANQVVDIAIPLGQD